MAINPINLSGGEFKVPQMDFSWLANLPATAQTSKLNQAKLAASDRQQAALAELGTLNPNDPDYYKKVSQIAFRMGDFGSGASVLEHGVKAQQIAAEQDFIRKTSPGGGAATPAPAPAPGSPPPPPARPVPAAPTLAAPPQTPPGPQVAPGIPPLGAPPGQAPAMSRPGLTTASLAPQPTPPIMAQQGAPGANFRGIIPAVDKRNVNLAGVNQNLMQVANEVGNELYGKLNRPLLITSAKDSVHTRGSAHYEGDALDLRTRDLSAQQRGLIVAGFRAKGLNAVDEGDHIHVSTRGGGSYTPSNQAAPGTVAASLQGRGPIGYSGGTDTRTASINPNLTANPAVASDADISPTPMARTSAVGGQPADVTNPGGAQSLLLPTPAPLEGALPPMNLAALGGTPGGVGTIGPMGGQPQMAAAGPQAAPPAAPNAPPVQMAQAKPYSPPFFPNAAPAAPAPFVRPPAQTPAVAPAAAPAVAPAPGTARGPIAGSPLERMDPDTLYRMSLLRHNPQAAALAAAEIARRSALKTEQNKPTGDYGNYLKAIDADQFNVPDTTPGAPPGTMRRGTFPEWLEKYGPKGQVFQIGGAERAYDIAVNKGRGEAIVKRMGAAAEGSTEAARTLQIIGAIETIMPEVGGNFGTAVQLGMAQYGVVGKGVSDTQAVQSLISSLIPKQREPGSGNSSDRDMEVFARMVPSFWNTPGANQLIMTTMKSYAHYQQQRGNISALWEAGKLTDGEAVSKLHALDTSAADITTNAIKEAQALRKASEASKPAHPSGLKDGSVFKKPDNFTDEEFADWKRQRGYY